MLVGFKRGKRRAFRMYRIQKAFLFWYVFILPILYIHVKKTLLCVLCGKNRLWGFLDVSG